MSTSNQLLNRKGGKFNSRKVEKEKSSFLVGGCVLCLLVRRNLCPKACRMSLRLSTLRLDGNNTLELAIVKVDPKHYQNYRVYNNFMIRE
jgi:hypothetical protein